MPSHFSDMGFPVTEENYDETLQMIFEKSQSTSAVLENRGVTYVVAQVDSAMEFWFSVKDRSVSADNLEFHYAVGTYLEAEEPEWLEDFSSATSGLLRIKTAEYPLSVCIPNRAMAPDFVAGKKYVCQVAAYAEEVSLFDSEEAFYRQEGDDGVKLGHEAVIPVGTFGFDEDGNIDEEQQSAQVLINGTVVGVEYKTNSYTGVGYDLVKIRSYGAVFTALFAEKTFDRPIRCGNIVSGTFWLSGKVIEKYAGSELAELQRLKPGNGKIQTLDDLYNVVSECWCAETAYPSCQKDWKESDRAFGQCAITAMLVHDMFGGAIHKIREGGGTHYFNKINGVFVDLTAEQFSYFCQSPNYERNQEVDRQYCGKNEDTKKRFQLLVKRVAEYLNQ